MKRKAETIQTENVQFVRRAQALIHLEPLETKKSWANKLLVCEPQNTDRWSLPGVELNIGEHAERTLANWVSEGTGQAIQGCKLVGVSESAYYREKPGIQVVETCFVFHFCLGSSPYADIKRWSRHLGNKFQFRWIKPAGDCVSLKMLHPEGSTALILSGWWDGREGGGDNPTTYVGFTPKEEEFFRSKILHSALQFRE